MDRDQLLELYFSGNIDESQMAELKSLLAEDDDLRSDFEFQKDLKPAIADFERQRLKAILKNEEKEAPAFEGESTSYNLSRFIKVAASLLLLATLSWFTYVNVFGNSSASLYDDYYNAYPNTYFEISRGSDQQSLERKAFEAYETEQYDKAIELFSELRSNSEINYLDFYIGQSFMALDQYEEAINYFNKIQFNVEQLRYEAIWYEALCYLHVEKKKNALENLKLLISNQGYKYQEATELIKKMGY